MSQIKEAAAEQAAGAVSAAVENKPAGAILLALVILWNSLATRLDRIEQGTAKAALAVATVEVRLAGLEARMGQERAE